MTSNKQNLFIWARKRGFTVQEVYKILKAAGLPLTHNDSPRTMRVPYIGPDGNTYYTRVRWDRTRWREITERQLTTARMFLLATRIV